jgi:hypothetical protein
VLRPFIPDYAAAYKSLSQTGLFFDLTTVGSAPASIIIESTKYTTCNAVCGITTTTTTTATPTTTTTTTVAPTTTTTTTADPYVYFNATVAQCSTCGPAPIPNEKVKFLIPFTFTAGKVYIPQTFAGFFYANLTSTTFDVDARLMSSTEYSGCFPACGITTTTTTTAAPTTTTTTTLPPYKFYRADRRATCNTGIENPVAVDVQLPYAFTPVLNNWYRDSAGVCTYSYRISNITPITPAFTPIPVDAVNYATSLAACGPDCIPTTTTTTTLPPINFTTSGGCENGTAIDGVGAIVTFSGGGGTYQASNQTYSTEALALAGTYTDITTTRTFPSLSVGTYWVAVRDKANTSNRLAKSFAITACPPTISLGSAYCAEVACLTPGGSAVVPCGGGYNVNISNAPAGYTVTMTYSVQGGPDGSYANLTNPSTGVYKVRAWFAAAGSSMLITLNLLNSSGGVVATSPVATITRSSPSNFLGLPACTGPSNVTLSPQNDLGGDNYTVYINGVADAAWNSGTRSYPANTTIKVVYSSPACGVTLNGNAYTSNTTITLTNGDAYTFVLYNADHYVDSGDPYCEGCQRRQGTINDCGTTSYRVVANDSCLCGQACGGTYWGSNYCDGNALKRTQYYTCNDVATGTVETLDDCSCTCNVGCDGTYWGANYCDGDALKRKQYYYCNDALTGVIETLDACSCACNIACDGTTQITYCEGTTAYGRLRYNCDNETWAGDPYVIAYNSPDCGYVPTYTLAWNLFGQTTSFSMYIYVNGAAVAISSTNALGIVTVSIGDLVEIVVFGYDNDFVTAAISTSGFGNDPLGYYSACDLYSATATTPVGGSRLTIIGDCSVYMNTYNDIFSCF